MPKEPDESIELQRELLREMQRVNDRLDMLANYEEKEPTWVFHLGWVAAFVLFFGSVLFGVIPNERHRYDGTIPERSFSASPVIVVGVFFVMIIVFCQTYVSRRVSPAFLAWEREQERKREEKAKLKNGQ